MEPGVTGSPPLPPSLPSCPTAVARSIQPSKGYPAVVQVTEVMQGRAVLNDACVKDGNRPAWGRCWLGST